MNTLKRFFSLAAPFWFRKTQWREWLLLAAVVGFSLGVVQVSVKITAWNKTFYDALADFNGAVMPALIAEFLGYIALVTAFVVCGNWLRKTLLLRWRTHLTQQFERQWLAQGRHYRLQITGEPDNPDQRIAEDVYLLSEKSIDLFKYFIMNAAKLGAFVAVLWQLSGVQTFQIGGKTLTVYGYLVWVALVWSALCTLATHLIGRKLQVLNVERQHREADYRATLLRIRDHSEQIALYRGEAAEQGRLNGRFSRIQSNWRQLIGREFKLETFTAAYLRLSMFIPIIATLPMYLAKTMTFGDMMQARSAFGNVQDGFGWFMDYYKRIIEWAAVVERLAGFQTALAQVSGDEPPPHDILTPSETVSNTTSSKHAPSLLTVQNLTVHTAEGRVLLQNLSAHAAPREWLLLDGRSGIGKSTLLRVLAGLWPYYRGHFQTAADALFLPQRPYLPQDSLRRLLAYPRAPLPDDETLKHILRQVGLAQLADSPPDEIREWHKILSGGEQQRLSLARALLHRPAVLLLDEATNQLDDDSALALMQLLQSELPDTAVIAVSHQADVKKLFDTRLDLTAFATGGEAV
ncbi:putative ATP-binding cassette transporter [Neisseria perflava]|uniref:ABC transporter ATP-binding protein/permease n=1 Tax=Neisseria perflava TaxID=33053 RepID=UPI0020A1A9EA|nr:ABC transporter ATP-binding protein/permease [Neisseria perflava]MCP1771803.1 putative ATP-binding cassette transporter [Neisseria perflava]